MELLERLYAKLVFVNGGRMLSTHVVILRTSTLNTVYNDGYMRRQRLAVMCEVVPVWLRQAAMIEPVRTPPMI